MKDFDRKIKEMKPFFGHNAGFHAKEIHIVA